ncbi:MAG: hypothetical protein WAW16_02990 [Candidatus Cryosericum sp.]
MARSRTSIIEAAAILVIAAGVLAALLFVPSLSTWREPRVRCSLQLDHPAPLPSRAPLTLTFVTRGTQGPYAYEVSVDSDVIGQGTTSADQFTVPVTFGASGVSMISVKLTVNNRPFSFLFSLAVS